MIDKIPHYNEMLKIFRSSVIIDDELFYKSHLLNKIVQDTIDNNQTRSKREMYYLNKYSITTTSNNCNSSINRSEHCYTISEVNTSKYTCSSEEMNEKYRLLMIKYNKEKNKE